MLLRTLPSLNRYEHKVITLKQLGSLTPNFVSAGITVESVHCKNLFDLFGIFRLHKLVREESPDIIITYLFHADMLGRLFLRMAHTPVIPFLRTTYNHQKYFIARILEWLTKPLVKQYLANSEAVKDFYTQHIGVNPKKITVIPNGINVAYFDSLIPNLELKTSLMIPAENSVIICVANLHINKGHSYLLEAFEKLYQEDPNIQLLLVGDGVEYSNLKKQIQKYTSRNNILFLGRRSDVPELLMISDLFVLPTLFEGQSNAILEAMASGLPIITTDIPENKVFLKDTVSGILVPPKDSSLLYQALQKSYQDPIMRTMLSKEARKIIDNSFSLEKILARWENTLNTVIKWDLL